MRIILVAVLAVGWVGCNTSKYSFVDVPLNGILPADFKNRTVISNSVDFRLNPESYIGEVISPKSAGEYMIVSKPVLDPGSKPVQELFKDGQIYRGQIDKGASAQGSYLTSLTANMTAKQTADV